MLQPERTLYVAPRIVRDTKGLELDFDAELMGEVDFGRLGTKNQCLRCLCELELTKEAEINNLIDDLFRIVFHLLSITFQKS
jgi:hypothetical protein